MLGSRRSSAAAWVPFVVVVVFVGAAAHPAAKKVAPRPKAPTVADPDSSDFVATPARWPGFPMLPDGRFPIVAYSGPHAPQTTDFRYAELAQTGINVTLKMLDDPGTPAANQQRIQVAARHNVWSFILDNRLIAPGRAYTKGWRAEVESTVATYAREPNVLGYFLADEPTARDYLSFAAITQELAKRDPGRPGLVDFMGFPGPGIHYSGMSYSKYLRGFLDRAHPALFAVDSYPLRKGNDFPYYVTCWESVSTISRQTGTPFWPILLLSPYANLRVPSTSEMAWQAFIPMAYGARGIVWFTYWTPSPAATDFHDGPMTYDGRRTSAFGHLTDVNARVQALGQEMGRWEWLGTRQVGTLPYGCRAFAQANGLRVQSPIPLTVGFFKQMSGQPYALFVNRDYKRVANVKIFAADTLLRWTHAPGLYRPLDAAPEPGSKLVRNSLTVSPGDAELVRLPRGFDYLATQH